ncbi:MAG: M1 family aminopeptidase, partial [Acidimicrobiia bacterium]
YCRRSLAAHMEADELFEVTKAGFSFFELVFGYPYAFGKYDQLFIPESNSGAMENAGCITFNDSFIFRSRVTDAARERRAETLLHEMAHMWFGDLVTMRWWDDLWLNESFATFASHLAMVEATRFRSAWTTFASAWKVWAYRQDQLPSTHPIVADAPDIEAMKTNFDGITYAKGASVLRQLVAWVGQDEFLAGVRAYFKRHAWGNTELGDFLGALEETSGRDLSSWSAEWLETTGVNTLRGRFETGPEGAFTSFDLEQEAAPDLVLVNDLDWAYAKIRLDPRSLATVTDHLGTLSDPLARSLCWAAVWDMLRDAELPARRYLDIVLHNLAGEDEIAVVGGLLRNAEAAAVVYGDPANREPARRRLAEHAEAGMRAAPPGSDLQLAFTRSLGAASRSEDHLALLTGLLSGAGPVEGLEVDTELRWTLVRSLAVAGAAGHDVITAEEERDPTDAGHRYAAAARAARPDEEAKAAAWDQLVGGDLPLATMRAVMGGFRQPDQEQILSAWVEPYFAALGPVWDRRGSDVGMSFTDLLYPVSDGAAQLTEAYLAANDPPPPVRRLLLEGRDQAQRVARARACDSAAG